ncbi:MAG: putative toxin-antitoxin system toxin component, PIN family, partial [bacterium]
LTLTDVEKFLRFVAYVRKPYKIYYLFRPNLKDESDNMLVELAVISQSDYLITNNTRDFRNAELKFESLRVITPADFVKLWRKNYG